MSAASFSIPHAMSALSLVKPGRPPQIALTSRPTPTPGPGEVLLRVDACGFCHHDLLVMSGVLRRGVAADVILGHEISGMVAAVAPDVTSLQPGEPGREFAHCRLRPMPTLPRRQRTPLPRRIRYRPRPGRRFRPVRRAAGHCPRDGAGFCTRNRQRCWPARPASP